ncbi:hypothetical protein HZS_4282 [Henneguya salminicola]|nr:hypothetical protein HZS_4282 [Henneguya salminicola]
MAGNNYYFQGNSIADSLNEIRLHVSSFKKYSNTLKNLTKKTETYNSQIENKLKNLTDNLMPIREQILDHYVKLKNATECIRLIKKYSDFNESLKECQKIISRDGHKYFINIVRLSSSNRNAYFQAVRNAKTSVEYFHVNAPFNSQFNDWKNLMEESLVTLRKVIDIELNNSVVVNEQKLIDNVVKWTLEGNSFFIIAAIQPNILESDKLGLQMR